MDVQTPRLRNVSTPKARAGTSYAACRNKGRHKAAQPLPGLGSLFAGSSYAACRNKGRHTAAQPLWGLGCCIGGRCQMMIVAV